jgi:predicted Zn-dependent peptidase
MNRIRYTAIALVVAAMAVAAAVPAVAQTVDALEYQLENGMQVLIVPKHETPTFMAAIVARVGSANETTGITGISHLFEHMMFKGTEIIGTKDYARDKEIMSRLDALRAEMMVEQGIMREALRRGEIGDMLDPEAKTDHFRELESEFDQLIEEQRELIIKDQLDETYTKNGGSFLNAMTSYDMTMYFIRLPANKLELFCWMESDRFLNPVFREFYSERNVVREERRLGVDSTPTGLIDEDFLAMFWKSSSYHWDVIGWPSDLDSITRKQAKDYFGTYYAPNNLTLIMVGDLDPEATMEQVRKYFERLPRGEKEPPEVVTLEERQYGEKRLTATAETDPQAEVWYHTVAWKHADSYALDLLGEIMNGKTGRLYKKLVEEKGLAKGSMGGGGRGMGGGGGLGVRAGQDSRRYAGAFQISAEGLAGVKAEELEAAIHEVVDELKTELVTPNELQKVKNQVKVSNIRFMDIMGGIGALFLIAPNAAMGDWEEVNRAPQMLDAVTAEDVRRVTNTYFANDQRNVLIINTKEAPEGEERKRSPGGGGMEERIKAIEDPAMLEQAIGMINMGLGSTDDPERKEQLEKMLQIANERLEELKEAADSTTDSE